MSERDYQGTEPFTGELKDWKFKRALRKAGLPELRFHDLRPIAASLMLEAESWPDLRHRETKRETTDDLVREEGDLSDGSNGGPCRTRTYNQRIKRQK
jgi:integrase